MCWYVMLVLMVWLLSMILYMYVWRCGGIVGGVRDVWVSVVCVVTCKMYVVIFVVVVGVPNVDVDVGDGVVVVDGDIGGYYIVIVSDMYNVHIFGTFDIGGGIFYVSMGCVDAGFVIEYVCMCGSGVVDVVVDVGVTMAVWSCC